MIIEQALMTKLNAISALATITGSRIYFIKAPQDVDIPYITIQKVSAPRGHHYTGADGMVISRFQLSAFAATYKECKDIAEAIRGGLDGSSGLWSTVTVGYCDYDNETDLWNEDVIPGGLYGIALDYMIQYSE